ncbi:GTPase Era [uncultured Butyricicoccus sp.]|jgi:[FeFe] hydrogenase H-cluster maturation GTPase HydF|nr:GTPase Era [uncultured Butyricicoccus sp.]
MGLNAQPSGERVHIGFFGLRNAGKSSVVNRVTGQTLSIVSDVKGTTTDPVQKAMELLPIGPVVIIDTPGIDDEGTLGAERIRRALRVLEKTDIAVLVTDSTRDLQPAEQELLELFRKREIPFIIAHNKTDLTSAPAAVPENEIYVSAAADSNIRELKELIARAVKPTEPEKRLVADLLAPNDTVVLVVPIDSAAPKGRLILPQQQTIRDILEAGAISLVTRETELTRTLESLREPPQLVITDSQAFGIVDKLVPKNVLLTSFSILFARYKGNLRQAILGAAQLNSLQDGDTVLISEGCTHHRQCGDIGTEKLPNWIRRFTGKDVQFSFTAGNEFPEDVSKYALVVHCGGCMLNEREMQYRLRHSAERNVPMTNYGIAIAHMHGILDRALAPFPDLHQAWSSTANG